MAPLLMASRLSSQDSEPVLNTFRLDGQLSFSREFEQMTWGEASQKLRLVVPVVREVVLQGDIGVKLKSNLPLTEAEVELLLGMVRRYRLSSVPLVSAALEKTSLSEGDYKLLLGQFKKVLRRQRAIIAHHIRLRTWLHSMIVFINAFEPDETYEDWLDENFKKIIGMRNLEQALLHYEWSLDY